MRKVNVWLDDVRPAPEDWLWCRDIFEVVALLKRREVRRLSLDHDLGPEARKSGYDLCVWMAKHGKWSDEKPVVHSMNPVGAFAMRAVIDRYWPERPPHQDCGCVELQAALRQRDNPGKEP